MGTEEHQAAAWEAELAQTPYAHVQPLAKGGMARCTW